MRFVVVAVDPDVDQCCLAVVEAPTPNEAMEAAQNVYQDSHIITALTREDIQYLLDLVDSEPYIAVGGEDD